MFHSFRAPIRSSAALPVFLASALAGCAAPEHAGADAHADASMFVVLGEQGVPVLRVLTPASACPAVRIDGRDVAMHPRAAPQTLPLRATRSAPADSKPSDFPLLACEQTIPAHAASVTVDGRALPLPAAEVNRIVVIGDTGCRIKKSDNAAQACNDARLYPFADIAAAAAKWKPDLVVHVGDYLYRENACPEGNAGCAGSPWGYGWDAWNADFFKPARPLLLAAPWVMVRGNHESCNRAGQGWWRLLDPRPLSAGRDCIAAADDSNGDYSDPYAVPIGKHGQIIVLDTSNTPNGVIPQGNVAAAKYADLYRKLDALSQQADYNIGVNHHPILGFAAREDKQGKISIMPGNAGLQSVFGAINPLFLPPRVNAMLSGHVHVWEQISFSSPHPTQFVAGFSGTSEDIVPLPASVAPGYGPAPGAIVDHFSSWVNGFGYMTMERRGADQWDVRIWDTAGRQVNACRMDGSKSGCELGQVK
ncbi:MAG TPA: metallophosphoesterase [Janthinobacterium sp.]|nr:metallophosphoesterase [Janthinobacterium sp.]